MPRIYCHYCRKERPRFLAYTCNYCKEYFCIDHIFPENHHCPDCKTESKEKQHIPLNTPTAHPQQTPIPSQTEQISKSEKKNTSETTTEQRTPGKKRVFHLTSSLIIIIVLMTITSVSATLMVQQNYSGLLNEKSSLEQEISVTKSQIVNTSSSINTSRPRLEQINTELLELISLVNLEKIGDTYQLHDPLSKDVTQFIANDTSSDIILELQNAKAQGIQCAYVIVQIVSSSNGEYELLGFKTLDEGMVYFEPMTDYRVTPIIGTHYADCVEGTPYSSPFDDTITSIVTIW